MDPQSSPPHERRRRQVRAPKPTWDEARHEQWFRGKLVRRISRRASIQVPICRAFEEQGWPPRIADPLSRAHGIVAQQRLHDGIKLLNRGQTIIHFGGDDTGCGVIWRAIEQGEKKVAKKRQRP